MSTKLPGYEDTVICPYNKCHVILRQRIQTHLIKCARSHPDIKLETCPFDVTHRYRKEDEKAHLEECSSRENFDRYVYSVSSGSAPVEPTPRPRPPPPPKLNDEEDWDHYNTPTYDPQKYAMNAKVLRAPGLMTPSERRQFADSERQRLSQLERRQQ